MARLNTNFRWITSGTIFIAFFLYFFVFNRYHLNYLEQIQLFRFNSSYFSDFLTRPGGLSEYIGAFLTQFFLFRFIGALIVTLAGIALYTLTGYIFGKHRITGIIWSLVPVMLLAALQSNHLYTLAYSVGLIFSLGYFAVNISIESNKFRYLFLLLGWPLLYVIAGGYAILTILLCFIHELLFRKYRWHIITASVYPIFALLVPFLASKIIFYIKAEECWTYFIPLFIGVPYLYIQILIILYFPFVLVAAKILLIYLKGALLSPGWTWKTMLTGTLVLICLSAGIFRYGYDRKTETLLGIDHCVQHSDWDGVLKLAENSTVINRMIIHFTNLALFKTGHMGDKMFHYPQGGSGGLWLDWSQDWIVAYFGGEIYYHLAYISEAYRWAFEAMVAKGPNPRSLKRLAVTCLINDDIKLAGKYLQILDQSLFYSRWAKHYLSYVNNPEMIAEDKELNEKRHFEIDTDFISSDNFGNRLPQLLADHPDNRMAFEYMMAAFLLDKNLDDFAANIYRLKDFGYKSVPVHYEEALLAYMSYSDRNPVPAGYEISISTRKRLSDYAAAIYSFGNNTERAAREMYSKFGNTYWYYLKFINN
jgi:MFS family permease